MELKNFSATDLAGNVIPNPTAYLYMPGTTTLATGLVDQNGSSISNPLTGASNGSVSFAAPDGDYDLRIIGAGRDYTMRIRFSGLSISVDSISELRKIKSNIHGRATVFGASYPSDGGGGLFCVDQSDSTSSDNGSTVVVGNDGARWKIAHQSFGQNANNLGVGLKIGGANPKYGTDGMLLAPDGHPSWMRIQPSKNNSPAELLVYPSSSQGVAVATAGTGNINRVSGTPFSSSWVGKRFSFGDSVYKVSAVSSADSLTVVTTSGGAVSFSSAVREIYHVAFVSGAGVCNTSGTAVSRISGDPFVTFASTVYLFKVNGVVYQIDSISDIDNIVLSASAGSQSGVSFYYEANINDALSTIRIQKLIGENEENLSIFSKHSGYWIASQISGADGKYRPVRMASGEITPGTAAQQVVCQPNGDLTLGGDYGWEALRVLKGAGAVNRFEVQGATAGFSPALRARGSDAVVSMGFDVQGNGSFNFTSHGFGALEFQVFGVGGSSWLGVGSSSSDTPTLSAIGGSNASVKISGNGTGGVKLSDGGGASRIAVDAVGGIRLFPLSTATPLANGEITIQKTSNTTATLKMKGDDGVVRSCTLTFA